MRIWGKIWKNNHLLRDTTIEDFSDNTRTHKVFHALDEICLEFDLGKPIWLDSNIREFQKHSSTWEDWRNAGLYVRYQMQKEMAGMRSEMKQSCCLYTAGIRWESITARMSWELCQWMSAQRFWRLFFWTQMEI